MSNTVNRRKHALQMLIDTEEAGASEESCYVDDACPNKKSKEKEPKQQKNAKTGIEFRLERLNGRLPGNIELANLLHYCLIGSPVEKPSWTIFKNWKGFLQTVFFRVNCNQDYVDNSYESFKYINNFFNKDWTKLDLSVSNRDEFWRDVTNVRRSLGLEIKAKLEGKTDPLLFHLDANIRLKLLLSLQEMISLQHPFPNQGLEDPRIKIIPTKQKYRKVTEKSPIFTLDCEMCMTKYGDAELTRISMMDENGKIVMDSLVKPSNEITDYLTVYSGITPEVMKDVNITLEDIQKAISLILPDDAILCGHSLEFDLRAMRMSHPYIIDVGALYDLKGKTRSRTSLKTLAQVFLRKEIQDETIGHCSVEDALATLELLQLKFKNGIHFGKICSGWNFQRWNQAEKVVPDYCTRYLNLIPTLGLPKEKVKEKSKAFSPTLEIIKAANTTRSSDAVQATDADAKLESKEIAEVTEELIKTSPIVPKFCARCDTKIGTNCIAKGCKCANLTPEICVRCHVSDIEKKKRDEPAHIIDENEEFLEWREAVTVEQFKSSVITDYVAEYSKKGTKTILAAFKNPEQFVNEEKICHLLNSANFNTIQEYVDAVKPNIMEHRLCLLERDCDSSSVPYPILDKAVKDLIGASSKNSLIIFMLESPEKSILYAKSKNY